MSKRMAHFTLEGCIVECVRSNDEEVFRALSRFERKPYELDGAPVWNTLASFAAMGLKLRKYGALRSDELRDAKRICELISRARERSRAALAIEDFLSKHRSLLGHMRNTLSDLGCLTEEKLDDLEKEAEALRIRIDDEPKMIGRVTWEGAVIYTMRNLLPQIATWNGGRHVTARVDSLSLQIIETVYSYIEPVTRDVIRHGRDAGWVRKTCNAFTKALLAENDLACLYMKQAYNFGLTLPDFKRLASSDTPTQLIKFSSFVTFLNSSPPRILEPYATELDGNRITHGPVDLAYYYHLYTIQVDQPGRDNVLNLCPEIGNFLPDNS